MNCDNCGAKIEDKKADNICTSCGRRNGSEKLGKKLLEELLSN